MAESIPLAATGSLATRIADLLRPARVPVIRQSEHSECGLACLAMVASAHGQMHDLPGMRRRVGVAGRGLSLAALVDQASRIGLAGRAVRLEPEELADLRLPAILHWNLDHWVVLVRVGRRGIRVHDPALGEREFGWPEVARRFSGVALELVPTGGFERADTRRRLRVADFLRQIDGWRRTATALFALAGCTQLLALAAPLHVQLVVDEAIVRADRDLVAILALGFAAVAVLRVIIGWLRDTVALRMATALSFQLTGNLFEHLVRLPLAWFAGRPLGDIASRFGSVEPVRSLLSEGIVAALLDSLLVAGSLAMMLLWAPKLAAVVVAAVLVYALLRVLTMGTVRRHAEAVIAAGAAEDSHFLETLRAMPTLRAAGVESRRVSAWQDLRVAAARAQLAQSAFGLRIGNANALLFAAENLVVVWLGALAVVEGSLSVGMLYAFVAWKHQFTDRMAALVDRGAEWRMLRLHLERLADIALEPAEVDAGPASALPAIACTVKGQLGLRGVRHRYGEAEPWVFEPVDVEVAGGSLTVIVGASGGGKSTLLRILGGLLPPAEGTVLVDGEPLDDARRADYRPVVATVLQDDVLLSGTIIDNITLWDPDPDHDALQLAIRQTGLEAVLAGFPLRGDTAVGEGGTLLSGGQRQRVLLARALYRTPRVLLLDEPLAHLDPVSAATLLATIEGLHDVTRVMVSHDPGHGRSAGRVLCLVDGRLRAWREFRGAPADAGVTGDRAD